MEEVSSRSAGLSFLLNGERTVECSPKRSECRVGAGVLPGVESVSRPSVSLNE